MPHHLRGCNTNFGNQSCLATTAHKKIVCSFVLAMQADTLKPVNTVMNIQTPTNIADVRGVPHSEVQLLFLD